MVKDLRKPNEKGKIQEQLTNIVEEVTTGRYDISKELTIGYISDGGRDPDLFIIYKITDADRLKGLGLTSPLRYPLEVHIEDEKDIKFIVPKGDTMGLKIAEAYEEKFGKDIITIDTDSLKDEYGFLLG